MNGYSVTGSATRASTGNPALDKIMAEVRAAQKAEAERKAAKKAAAQPEAVTRTVLTAEPSKSVSATITLAPPAANELAGKIQFGKDIAQPQTVGDASGLLASMKQAQEAPAQQSTAAILPFPDEKVMAAAIRAEAEALYGRISKRYIKFSGDGPPKVFNIDTGEFMSKESFIEFLKDSPEYGTVDIGTEDRPKVVSCAEPWFNWAMDHKFTADRIVMEPTNLSREEELQQWEHTPNHRTYNRWHDLIRGRVQPDLTATKESIAPLLEHLHMLSGQEPLAVEHFMCQMAQIYRFPQHKLRTANFWYSRCNYVGKSMLIDLFRPVFGGSPLVDECDGASLGDKFTALLKDALIRMFNEVPIMDAARYDATKTLVSEKTRKSEGKGKDAVPVKNFVNLILTSNNLQALPLAMGDPRFNVFRYDGERMPDEYYKALGAWIAGPGPALFAGVLANWVFPADWDVVSGGRLAPQTEAAKAMQREARGDLVNFLDGLIAGRIAPFDKPIGRPAFIVEQLGQLFTTNCRSMKVTSRTVADALRKLGASPIGSGTAAKDNALCWRNQDKWAAVRLKDWKAYLDDDGQCPVPDEDDEHE